MHSLSNVIIILTVMLKITACFAGEAQDLKSIRQRVQAAENNADLGLLKNLFTDDAVYLNPEGPPIVGSRAIRSLYAFMFNRYKWTSSYQNNSTEMKGDSAWIRGMYSYKLIPKNQGKIREGQDPFEWLFLKKKAGWKLARLIYGELVEPQSRVPALPKPTGEHQVGIRDFFFADSARPETFTADAGDVREVAVQIWYPAENVKGRKPRPYQNPDMTKAAAHFLGWPLFANSYSVFVQSHSFSNAAAKTSPQPYPVILYNHGYGGFTTVHQTVCEELASHGYVVVSVGHAYESALFLKPDGSVKAFDPQNKAYRARRAESGGREQERLKDRIIRAANFADRENSYRRLLEKSPLHQQSVQIWAADNHFVLKKLEQINAADSILKGMVDFENAGIIGHSLGGATAGEMASTEPKIKAGINLDGFQFGGLPDVELKVPFMFMWENGRNVAGTAGANDLFFQKSQAACYSLVIKGFEHATFTDLPLFASIWQSAEPTPKSLRAIQLQREYILAFFNKHLKNRPAPLLKGSSQKYPEVVFKSK
ncbi:isoform II [bacterium BMS3Bbin03]|nr:isoform II [bacterium BMS3Bbin03]